MYNWWSASSSSAVGSLFFFTAIGRPTGRRTHWYECTEARMVAGTFNYQISFKWSLRWNQLTAKNFPLKVTQRLRVKWYVTSHFLSIAVETHRQYGWVFCRAWDQRSTGKYHVRGREAGRCPWRFEASPVSIVAKFHECLTLDQTPRFPQKRRLVPDEHYGKQADGHRLWSHKPLDWIFTATKVSKEFNRLLLQLPSRANVS